MKIKYDRLSINLENPGVYVLDQWGGTGKTYAYRLLKSYNKTHTDKACLITYSEEFSINKVFEKLRNYSGSLIFLDRADLYFSKELAELLNNLECLILIDIKATKLSPLKYKTAQVYRTREFVEIKYL